jgi:putative endonuclease
LTVAWFFGFWELAFRPCAPPWIDDQDLVTVGTRELGKHGEELAVRFLIRKRYRILARNWRDRGGEIDIVARDGGTLVFVEVKTRTSDTFALPVESVGYEKQRKLRRLAERYTMRSGMSECEARFDVVSVIMRGAKPEIEHLTNAF